MIKIVVTNHGSNFKPKTLVTNYGLTIIKLKTILTNNGFKFKVIGDHGFNIKIHLKYLTSIFFKNIALLNYIDY